MSDELMQQIKQTLEDQHRRGFNEGWQAGYEAAWETHAAAWDAAVEFMRKSAARRPESSKNGDGHAEERIETPPGVTVCQGPRLTPGQQRAVDYVTENQGLTSNQIRGIGKGTLYGLAKAGVLAKIDGRFYPADHN